jgi:hypothetical protein
VRRVRSIAYLLFGLAIAASLMSVYLTYRIAQESAAQAASVDKRLSVLEQDLAERTRQRDAERDATSQEQERFRANLCVVLGELEVSPGLDSIRATLHCTQPGVAVPPPAPDRTTPRTAPSSTPSSTPSKPAAPAPSSPSPAPPPPASSAPASPSPAPGLLCGLLPIC